MIVPFLEFAISTRNALLLICAVIAITLVGSVALALTESPRR